jgi:hypothetical protein
MSIWTVRVNKMDFIVAEIRGASGFLSTNNHEHTVYGYCKNARIEDSLRTLQEYYPDCTYTVQTSRGQHSGQRSRQHSRQIQERPFTQVDKIYLNKLRYRLQKEVAQRLERQPER